MFLTCSLFLLVMHWNHSPQLSVLIDSLFRSLSDRLFAGFFVVFLLRDFNQSISLMPCVPV